MFYQNTLELSQTQERSRPSNLLDQLNLTHQRLIEYRLLTQQIINEQIKKRNETRKLKITSKNSIWDTVKLVERFNKLEYQSRQSKIDLLKFDADHFAREMALVETVTRFSYWHNIEQNETLGDGYFEDLSFMLSTFAQDLAENGFNASRATVETTSFNRSRALLSQIALRGENKAVLITSFPDDKDAGYHGVDSKNDWDKPETHHSFFYLLRVGDVKLDELGNLTSFEIKTTQYRLWPNARQALQIHSELGQPITEFDGPIPNLLFANLIQLDEKRLSSLIENSSTSNSLPTDSKEDSFESLFRQFIYKDSQEHAVNHTQVPEVNQVAFWDIHTRYFNQFYLEVALPVFEEIEEIKQKTTKLDSKTAKQIQEKIDYLDKAFFYYSKVLMGWVKINNTNPNYTNAFSEKNQIKKLMDFQQKLLLRLLGQKQTDEIPSVSNLKTVLDIDHRLATKQKVSDSEKKLLLQTWGFFSFVGNFSSLLQCGTLAPFTTPLSIMSKSFEAGTSIPQFSASLSGISIPEKQKFLEALKSEKYVELDLTKNNPPAKKVYSVPESYLDGIGCTVDENGDVLGPCIDPETKKRIPLDDPRDTLAFPMNLSEFNKYILALEKDIEQKSLNELDKLFEEGDFSELEKRKAQTAIKKLRQKLIKQSLGLQDFLTGDLTNHEFSSNNEWLKDLLVKLSFSMNPIEVLISEVNTKLKENDPLIEQVTSDQN